MPIPWSDMSPEQQRRTVRSNRRWRSRNRDRSREHQRRSEARRRAAARSEGLCVECGDPSPERVRCAGCRRYQTAMARDRRERKRVELAVDALRRVVRLAEARHAYRAYYQLHRAELVQKKRAERRARAAARGR